MANPITTLSLCSGVGWLDEAVGAGCRHFGWDHRVAAYCEWEAYAQAVLLARMEESSVEPAPVWGGDLGEFDGRAFRGAVDGIVAGFPCQPWSNAGKQLGTDDDRWLWPAIVRVIDDVEPGFVFLENVSALITGGGLEHVLSDFAARGFDAEWCCLTAEAVRASHRRERVFILAYDPSARGRGLPDAAGWSAGSDADRSRGGSVADSASEGGQLLRRSNRRAGCAGAGEVRGRGVRGQQRPSIDEQFELCNAAVDDTSSDGPREPGQPSEERPVESQGRGIESGGRRAAVAVPRRNGRRIGQPRGRSSRGAAAGGSGHSLANAAHADSACQRQQRDDLSGATGGRLADAERPGLEGVRSGNPERRGVIESCGGDRGVYAHEVFAPGPHADWSGIPEALWPATERGFRLLVDGSPVVLDESRADQLRCGGNGVVALQGAVAFVELVRRAMTSR